MGDVRKKISRLADISRSALSQRFGITQLAASMAVNWERNIVPEMGLSVCWVALRLTQPTLLHPERN
jgi:hypothetical protein